jgi:hypothetical protein
VPSGHDPGRELSSASDQVLSLSVLSGRAATLAGGDRIAVLWAARRRDSTGHLWDLLMGST